MARCGISLRHEVWVVAVQDDGSSAAPVHIGEAETLPMALRLAERQGYCPREAGEGGVNRFVAEESPGYFLISVFPP